MPSEFDHHFNEFKIKDSVENMNEQINKGLKYSVNEVLNNKKNIENFQNTNKIVKNRIEKPIHLEASKTLLNFSGKQLNSVNSNETYWHKPGYNFVNKSLTKPLNSEVGNENSGFPHIAGKIIRKMNFLVLTLTLVSAINLIILGTFYLTFNNNLSTVAKAESETNLVTINNESGSGMGVKTISKFLNANSITDIGQMVAVEENLIKNKETQNCKTPVIPPLDNGCGFGFLPYAAGVPSEGVLFKSLNLEVEMEDEDRIQIDLKNYEKSELSNSITLDKFSLENSVNLPQDISKSSGIYIRFWPKNEPIEIKKITINYFTVEELKDFSGKVSELSNAKAKIFWDRNSDGKFNEEEDVEWVCRNGFIGVKEVQFNENGQMLISKDDGCILEDEKNNFKNKILPPGDWLFVSNSNDSVKVVPFEISPNNAETKLNK